jgi:multidrug efflux pump subunit AcrA (membrane-fusion protein)
MAVIDPSSTPTSSRRAIWLWAALALLVGGTFAWFAAPRLFSLRAEKAAQTWYTVHPISLDVAIRQQGELQAVNNIDILCPVQGQNTLQQIVPEGTFVKAGDVIAILDSSEHRRNLEAAELELEKATSDVAWSKDGLKLQEVKNKADLDAANSELGLAKLDLREYTEGTYPQALKEAKRKLEMADISLKRKEEELETEKRLMAAEYSVLAVVQKSQVEVLTARNEAEKAANDLMVLTEYKHAKEFSEKQDKVTQAERKVARVTNENSGNYAQKLSELTTRERQLVLRKSAAERAKENLNGCTISATTEGMVLYASSVSDRYYESPIQAGSKIYQNNMIVRLPDVSRMKAVVKVPEARLPQLYARGIDAVSATVKISGVVEPISARVTSIAVLPDNTNRYLDPDLKAYPIDLVLDHTPPNLKPGTSATVTIYIDKLQDVLAVPLPSIYSAGSDQYVFARDGENIRPTKIEIGAADEKMVQVVSGIKAGEDILLLEIGQGRELLDKAGIKTDNGGKAPASQPSPTKEPAVAARTDESPQPKVPAESTSPKI